MSQFQSILEFRQGRYLKLACFVCAAAIAAYWWYEPPALIPKAYGGTWLGYTLGTVAAVIILWLMLLGIRKRRYQSNMGTVQGWASAHVYLGTSLIVIATLHCAFEFGWNIHTFAYVLMLLVIFSGFYGLYAYFRYPGQMTANLGGETLQTMLLKHADLDKNCRRIALNLPNEINELVLKTSEAAARRTKGVSFRLMLAGPNAPSPTRDTRDRLIKLGKTLSGADAKTNQQLVTEMTRMSVLVDRIRLELRYRAVLQVWLYFHVPLSFGLLAALTAHVISVFYFW